MTKALLFTESKVHLDFTRVPSRRQSAFFLLVKSADSLQNLQFGLLQKAEEVTNYLPGLLERK